MKYQARPNYCLPASIANAMRLLGKRPPSQKTIASFCCTTDEGSDEFDALRGLRALGLATRELHSSFERERMMIENQVCVLCLDDWGHWVTTQLIGNHHGYRWLVVDPERSPRNIENNGIRVLSWRQLKRRWACSLRSDNRGAGEAPYYGIAIIG